MSSTTFQEGCEKGQALQSLLRRVEGATGEDRELDCAIECALFGGEPFSPSVPGRVWRVDADGYGYTKAVACHTASLDAALALVEAADKAYRWRVERLPAPLFEDRPYWATCGLPGQQEADVGATPSLALIAALLHALIAEQAARQSAPGKSLDSASPQENDRG